MTATVLDHQPMTIIKLSGPLIREFGRSTDASSTPGPHRKHSAPCAIPLPGFKGSHSTPAEQGACASPSSATARTSARTISAPAARVKFGLFQC